MPLVAELLVHLHAEDLRGSRDELEDPAGGAVAAAGTMSPESAYSSLLDSSSPTGSAFPNAV